MPDVLQDIVTVLLKASDDAACAVLAAMRAAETETKKILRDI